MARRSGTERAGLAALLLLAAAAAQANDSSAEFAAGGLRLARTDAIRMEREDLSIGLDRIAVAYLFRNVTDRDVTLEVAFPLPDIDMNQMSETPHEFHGGRNDGDIFDFRLKIDGKPTVPAFDVHAVSKDGGRDVTGLLHQYRIPLVDDGTPGSDPMTLRSQDQERRGFTVSFDTADSLEKVAGFYRHELTARGYEEEPDPLPPSDRAVHLQFTREGHAWTFALSPMKGRTVVTAMGLEEPAP